MQDTQRDFYMSAEEAKEYGIIDHIIGGDKLASATVALPVAASS